MAFAPLAIDMYLPALPAIGRDLAATPAAVQLSLSSFFLGFGIGQLVWGPLGDRFGRRGPIVAGIVLYIVGCVACALTSDVDHLVLWRFVQAFGACAAPVLARAMVRDLFPQDQAARMLSLMMLIMGIAPDGGAAAGWAGAGLVGLAGDLLGAGGLRADRAGGALHHSGKPAARTSGGGSGSATWSRGISGCSATGPTWPIR